MTTKILLLRGVNVGGVKLPMAAFREMLVGLGLGNVRSYIQSGNAVFDDPGIADLAEKIAAGLNKDFDLSSAIFLYSAPEFDAILAECPFAAEGRVDGANVHLFFLAEPVAAPIAPLHAFITTERFALTPRALHLHAPNGIGRSALVGKLPRLLKSVMTARNWNTLRALAAMAKTP